MNILIADDHQMFASGLAALLREINTDFKIDMVSNGKAALAYLAEHATDLLITDISMPDMNGIELMEIIRQKAYDVKIMVVSMHTEIAIVKAILKENPDGYLLKNTDTEELAQALHAINQDRSFFCGAVKDLLLDKERGLPSQSAAIVPKLSPRELEVLQLIVAEKTTGDIAKSLFLSEHTIETYRKNLLRKLDAKNSVGLVAKAYQLGIL